MRDAERPSVHGIAAYQRRRDVTRAFQMRLSPKAEVVIMDAPAGVSGLILAEYVQRVDSILMPVLPSPIDIHAVAHFIQDLLLVGKARSVGTRIAIIANRVRENTIIYKDLENFFSNLNLPLVATLRDSQAHIRAAEQGLGLHELDKSQSGKYRERWDPLINWLDDAAEMLEPHRMGTVIPIATGYPGT